MMTRQEFAPTELALEAYQLMQRVHYTLDTHTRSQLRAHGLTVPQFAILYHATPEGVPLNEISLRMMCDNSNLTGIVDRLAAEGLVERHTAPYDRRVRLVRLTAAGAEKLRQVNPQHVDTIKKGMHALSDDQVQQLRNLLEELYLKLQHTPDSH